MPISTSMMSMQTDKKIKVRHALITGARSEKEVAAYLPNNYVLMQQTSENGKLAFIIGGFDDAGWTLDEYVIPRLASGMIACRELHNGE